MKKRILFNLGIFALISLILSSCSQKRKEFSYTENGDIWVRSAGLSLKFDKNMYCTLLYRDDNSQMNDNQPYSESSKPTHFIID